MYEQQIVLGHVGRDPEMRYTPTGKQVANFTLAATRLFPAKDGDAGVRKVTVWYKVIVWGKLAETCCRYVRKGRSVLVTGVPEIDLETGQIKVWTDKEGKSRASLGIVAHTVKFIGKGADSAEIPDDLPPAEDLDIPQDAENVEDFEDIPF